MTKKRIRITLKQRIGLCLAVFFAALAAQIALNVYQSRAVQGVMDRQMGSFHAISRFQGGVEGVVGALESYRWENGEQQEILARMEDSRSTCNAWLWRVESSIHSLEDVSEEQRLLYSAVSTTYAHYEHLLDRLSATLEADNSMAASRLYYDQVAACGDYLSQYTLQLLETAILDAQTSYTELSVLSARIGMLQTVVVGLCVALGCVSAMMVMQLLTPVQQMIAASWAIARSEFDSPDIPLPRGLEMAQLAEAFNKMKHSMAQQVNTLQEKNEIERELHRQKTQALITALSHLLRYSLMSNDEQVPLAREVRIVDEYYSIYHVRFGDRVRMEWRISDAVDLTEVMVPSFILQPIVENAFKHGICPKEEGGLVRIRVTPEPEKGLLYLSVLDNGLGIPPEQMAQLRKALGQPGERWEHIGLYNVAERLRLLDKSCRMSVCSRPGRGTSVRLYLPLVERAEEEF